MSTTRTVARTTKPGTPTAPVKRLSLADVIQGSKGLPDRMVFHGQAGIGKTSFAAQAPNPIFLLSRGETGLHKLIDNGLLPELPNLEIGVWPDLLRIIDELTTTKTSRETCVLDAGDGFERECNTHVRITDYKGDGSEFGFEGYQRGYKTVANGPWQELLAALDRLREIKRMGIILLAHTGVSNFSNPNGADFNRYAPAMAKYSWEATKAWADVILFGDREIVTSKEKGERKAKARGVAARTIFTEYSAVADAKNRHNLPPEIEMGNSAVEAWANYQAALAEGKNGNNKQEEK